MSEQPPGGGPRSLGASLLDDVLAETLDPAYVQAAQARAAATDSAPRRRWKGRVLVALTMVVAGLLAAVTYDLAAARVQGRQEIREALVADIRAESEVSDELAAELEELGAEVTVARDELLASSTTGQRALDALARAEEAAAAVPVTGPGLLVTLANAAPNADDDPVGGGTEADPRGRVRDGDLQQVVNALWAAGAEAISINGQRLGPTSAIRFAGEAVLVDFRPVTNPYEVRAIGAPDTLSGAFLASPEVRALALVSESFGLRFDFSRKDELTLPAATTPELRSAQPVTDEDPVLPSDPAPGD
ncbi:DUF881 domain-containing protein [Candidatus Blastococcus massiliensis]|uniref:DUF881 domain-containing protein n=1 Tax=Candidatus Blastococcus massiliensis TaxID=1470358 RepID=UPI0004B9F2C7|nr:DUF881 domain-containing protein [Candidatus Blastococcus massiliensis]